MNKQTITLIDNDLSFNCLARTVLIAKLLRPYFNVIIKGFINKNNT